MNYNDFPILNNQEYKLLSEKFSQVPFNRKTYLFKICNELYSCLSFYSGLNNHFNSHIIHALGNSKTVLNKILENFSTTFNISPIKNQQFHTFNLFSFTKKILNTISLITTWLNNEEKYYYKTMALKNLTELSNTIDEILTALENSNLHFFKHM